MTLNRRIFKIAVPTIIGFLGLILFQSADVYWVGKLGGKAVAGMGAAFFLEWLLYALMNLTITGCGTYVAQYVGAQSEERFIVIRESFWLSLAISIVFVTLLYFSAPNVFSLMGLDEETKTLAVKYFRVFTFGFPILYLYTLQGQIFNSYGDTRTKTIIMLVILTANVILDPFLIFGWWIFPEWGIQGAAIATVSSEFVGLVVNHLVLRKKEFIMPIHYFCQFSNKYALKILKVGLPSATTNAVWTSVFPMLTTIITRFGMEPLAGLNIANRLEGFPYFFAVGFSIAISTLVGQSYGRGDKDQVQQIVKRGVILITIILLPVSLLFIIFPEFLMGVLSSDVSVIKEGAKYLRIVGYFEVFLGWELVIIGGFNGLGNTRPYMWLCVPITLIRVPLAYLLAIVFDFGITGVWWAITSTTLFKGTILAILFVYNRKNRDILSDTKNMITPVLTN